MAHVKMVTELVSEEVQVPHVVLTQGEFKAIEEFIRAFGKVRPDHFFDWTAGTKAEGYQLWDKADGVVKNASLLIRQALNGRS